MGPWYARFSRAGLRNSCLRPLFRIQSSVFLSKRESRYSRMDLPRCWLFKSVSSVFINGKVFLPALLHLPRTPARMVLVNDRIIVEQETTSRAATVAESFPHQERSEE